MLPEPESPSPVSSAALSAIIGHRKDSCKIAHLPKATRDRICTMLHEGHTYKQITEALAPDGIHVDKDHLSHWHGKGFQRWIEDQRWLDEMQDKLDFATDVLNNQDHAKIHEASLHIAVKQMYTLLAKFDPASFMEKLTEDPPSYARILSALSKLTEEALRYARARTDEAERQARLKKQNDDQKNLGLTPATRLQIEDEFQIL